MEAHYFDRAQLHLRSAALLAAHHHNFHSGRHVHEVTTANSHRGYWGQVVAVGTYTSLNLVVHPPHVVDFGRSRARVVSRCQVYTNYPVARVNLSNEHELREHVHKTASPS